MAESDYEPLASIRWTAKLRGELEKYDAYLARVSSSLNVDGKQPSRTQILVAMSHSPWVRGDAESEKIRHN